MICDFPFDEIFFNEDDVDIYVSLIYKLFVRLNFEKLRFENWEMKIMRVSMAGNFKVSFIK